ncbi:MAG: hypothetical protein EP343_18995 [Deltaproteobacteria bacterium]|nr:MAG: hypothetical protein EP343_18995 [Deltaproteobacteria bacterium]
MSTYRNTGLTLLAILAISLMGCTPPAERACTQDSDCKQSAPRLYCFQGVCSTQQCNAGQQKECYDGPLSSLNRGQCSAGKKVCNVDGLWSNCFGQKLPVQETCDREDNDCNGQVDDGLNCTCKPGEKQSCYSREPSSLDQGLCKAGTQFCERDRKWGRCLEQVVPGVEICDGKDNDCDGLIDNGVSCACEPGTQRSCYSSNQGCKQDSKGTWSCQGSCKAGQQVCGPNREWGACENQVLPQAETCDGKDNNCNGITDETCGCPKPGLQEYCYTGEKSELRVRESTCRQGRRVCLDNGRWSSCFGEVKPTTEVCDGKDNNCDGSIDESFPNQASSCTVADQAGPCASGKLQCIEGKPTCQPEAKPSDQETCGNGVDDNCNGAVDESPPCECTPGQSQTCFSKGSGCQRDNDGTWTCQGLCKTGIQFCQPNGTWSACEGEVLAVEETCDGKDNNCNGTIDDNWPTKGTSCTVGKGGCQNTGTWRCAPEGNKLVCSATATPPKPEQCDGKDNNCNGTIDENLQKTCYTGTQSTQGIGSCRTGTQTCSNGQWGACLGEVTPQAETCDGKDNDCNGKVDENLLRQCYTGPGQTRRKGLCRGGFQECANGSWLPCQSQTLPSKEVCDGQDNDCNGSIDENLQQACYTGAPETQGKGTCRSGTQVCTQGQWGACVGQMLPKPEMCDGKDNNCDGSIDEGLVRSCYSGNSATKGIGVCRAGTQSCQQGQWSTCAQEVTPQAEQCDKLDNDCDGNIDEGCDCTPNQTQACGSKLGECKEGVQTCNSQGQWGPCVGETQPTQEVCDGKDNNCNGAIDENWPLKGTPCKVGQSECQRAGAFVCAQDQQSLTCNASPGTPQPEVCDGKDNDCNGLIDENVTRSCYGGPSGTQDKGVCCTGVQACSNGSWGTCQGDITPSQEVCNNKDDDCDGSTDENLTQSCYTGPKGTSGWGECKAGQRTCSAGQWGACVGEVTPTPEACDNKDNNCNGAIDEGVQRSCYTGPTGTLNRGPCQAGVESCSAGQWTACQGEVAPTSEVCDGQDNDCNGMIDEGNPGGGQSCTTTQLGACAAGTQTCTNGSLLCQANRSPIKEVCNNKDDDCNGLVDDSLSQACKSTCGSGTRSCVNGKWSNNCRIPSRPEICDRKDNDCDGLVDEDGCECGVCNQDSDCTQGATQGKCVQGFCAFPCQKDSDCQEPFVCNTQESNRPQGYCAPPYHKGELLWTCNQYHQFNQTCTTTHDCGGGDDKAKTGAECSSSQCLLYCRSDEDCPKDAYKCSKDRCVTK